MEKKVDATGARQGRKGYHVLTILIVALILAGIAGWAAGLYGGAIEPEDPVGGAPAEQPAEPTPAPATD